MISSIRRMRHLKQGGQHPKTGLQALAAPLRRSIRLMAALLLGAPLVATTVLSQAPEPSAPTQRWTVYLPMVDRPAKELMLIPQARIGGAAMGIAAMGPVVFQAQGTMLVSWRQPVGSADWTRTGAIDLHDPAPVDGAWLSIDGGVLSYLRKLRVPGTSDAPSPTPFLRLSLLNVRPDGSTTAGTSIDLPGNLFRQARAGDRLYLVIGDPAGPERQLITFAVGQGDAPVLVDRQNLPVGDFASLLPLPETRQLLTLITDVEAQRSRLWTWDTRSGLPQSRVSTTLSLSTAGGVLVRIPEGVLALDGHGSGWVIPLKSKRLRLDRARAVSFDLAAISGPNQRSFAGIHASSVVGDKVCLYHGRALASMRTGEYRNNNLMACFHLPVGESPVLSSWLALDPLLDASSWNSGTHVAVMNDRLLLSQGSPGGFVEIDPANSGAIHATYVDGPPGRVEEILRYGERLITAEGDVQLRAWTIDDAAFAHLHHLGRLGLPGAGNLITRDVPSAPGLAAPQLVLWKEGYLGRISHLQRVSLALDPPLSAQSPSLNPEWHNRLRAAGDLLWSTHDGEIWRLGPEGRVPFDLPGRRGSLQDLAHLGRLRLLAAGIDGLIVLDEADQVVSRLALPDPATAVAVDEGAGNGVVWVATGGLPDLPRVPRQTSTLYCLDLSNPTAPRVVADIVVPGSRVGRLRAAGAGVTSIDNGTMPGARVAGSGWQRRVADGTAYDDALLFLVDARDCSQPRLEGVTRPEQPPAFLAKHSQEPGLTWELSPDGRRLFAAREGVEVYGLGVGP